MAEAEAPDVPLATPTTPVEAVETEEDEDSGGIAVTSNGHWTVVEQPPVTTRVTRRPSRRAASRPAGPPTAATPAPEAAAASEAQLADQHESAESQGEHTPV